MDDCNIDAAWRGRPETPAQIAQRLRKVIALLRPISPEFARWYQVIAEDNMPELDENEDWLASVIEAQVCTGDLGEPIPFLGYLTRTMNWPVGAPARQGQVCLSVTAGNGLMNYVSLISGNPLDLPAALLAYPVVKQTILAFSSAFEPLFSWAGPADLWRDMIRSDYKSGPIIFPCWMIHLSPPLARRISSPPGMVSERFDDGSLFLSVTEEQFSLENPAHVEGAHRLFEVLDTLQEKKPPEQWRR